jgi:Protein of unknown function (DUF3086)
MNPAELPNSDAGLKAVDAFTSVRSEAADLEQRVAALRQEEQRLKQDIATLQATQTRVLREQMSELQTTLGQLVQEGSGELEQRKKTLQLAVEQLERRQERIKAEMRTSFAGVSQDLAIRVQGFKDYLVGSLQDLAIAAEQLELAPRLQEMGRPSVEEPTSPVEPPEPRIAEGTSQEDAKLIRRLLDQYRTNPDYYGPAWQLRRTFEPIHAERISGWFFDQGKRGAVRTMGSRLQNILVASSAISILRKLHGDRLRTLVLADSPERLGEWRRGLQDCLGVSRSDFGADQGIMLFEAAEPLAQRADRLERQKMMPFIIIDESEDDRVSLSLLQFPLWLAIAPDPNNMPVYY